MTESRLQRWSRRKTEADRKAEPASPSTVESAPSPEAQELARNEALPEQEVLEKYGLPDPDTIELGTDITGFMRKEIPDLLRRRALRVLWKSNPVLAVLDGLNDYDEDFTDAGTAVSGAKTLYKVGQGLIDKTAKADGQFDNPIEASAEDPEPVEPGGGAGRSEPETAVKPLPDANSFEPIVSETEAEPVPRYRPRMRFD
ncbi:DUF3306 domain-containing protein [Marinobacter sp. SS8-8]|uniref:DUF3306 domain-containing protein n=1 Tax=Marinobacter sp. SS8-8 TaxID=3050452 RepID=UPI000C3CE44B|nr:DUF3306 domain-containing protein [Marinobacter sp. SS8-8]MAZ06254.1 hypothetical protein [Halomonas sp.]|tara:strand:- start:3943 stop:4542 length:600 start_codon:yes stop_codon:yes gene_type:complete